MDSPSRQVMIHQGSKTVVVVPFKQVDQFMDQDVFQAFRRLFG